MKRAQPASSKKIEPVIGWLCELSPGYYSCIVEFDEAKMKERKRCAKLCGRPIKFIKVKLTPCE